jgi:hypothetical protein
VERDSQVATFRQLLEDKARQGVIWAGKLSRIISLETVAAKLQNDQRYGRIETWPEYQPDVEAPQMESFILGLPTWAMVACLARIGRHVQSSFGKLTDANRHELLLIDDGIIVLESAAKLGQPEERAAALAAEMTSPRQRACSISCFTRVSTRQATPSRPACGKCLSTKSGLSTMRH